MHVMRHSPDSRSRGGPALIGSTSCRSPKPRSPYQRLTIALSVIMEFVHIWDCLSLDGGKKGSTNRTLDADDGRFVHRPAQELSEDARTRFAVVHEIDVACVQRRVVERVGEDDTAVASMSMRSSALSSVLVDSKWWYVSFRSDSRRAM